MLSNRTFYSFEFLMFMYLFIFFGGGVKIDKKRDLQKKYTMSAPASLVDSQLPDFGGTQMTVINPFFKILHPPLGSQFSVSE